jgi:hypothetical protein
MASSTLTYRNRLAVQQRRERHEIASDAPEANESYSNKRQVHMFEQRVASCLAKCAVCGTHIDSEESRKQTQHAPAELAFPKNCAESEAMHK